MQHQTAVKNLAPALSDAASRFCLSGNDVAESTARRRRMRIGAPCGSSQTGRCSLWLWLALGGLAAGGAILCALNDLGRMQTATMELHRIADSVARAASPHLGGGIAHVREAARTHAARSGVAPEQLQFENADIEVGYWDSRTRAFTPLSHDEAANAVRVTARRSRQRRNAVPLLMSALFCEHYSDVSASAIAVRGDAEDVQHQDAFGQ